MNEKEETLRVLFREPPEFLEHMVGHIAEYVSNNVLEFHPIEWDMHTDIDNLYMWWEDERVDGEIRDIELHIPMERVVAVEVLF